PRQTESSIASDSPTRKAPPEETSAERPSPQPVEHRQLPRRQLPVQTHLNTRGRRFREPLSGFSFALLSQARFASHSSYCCLMSSVYLASTSRPAAERRAKQRQGLRGRLAMQGLPVDVGDGRQAKSDQRLHADDRPKPGRISIALNGARAIVMHQGIP